MKKIIIVAYLRCKLKISFFPKKRKKIMLREKKLFFRILRQYPGPCWLQCISEMSLSIDTKQNMSKYKTSSKTNKQTKNNNK